MTLGQYMKDLYHQTLNIIESPAMKGFNFCIVDGSTVFVSPAVHECMLDNEIFKTTVENLECRFIKTFSFTPFVPIKTETVRSKSSPTIEMQSIFIPPVREVTSAEIISMAKKFNDAFRGNDSADPIAEAMKKAFTEGKDLFDWLYNSP